MILSFYILIGIYILLVLGFIYGFVRLHDESPMVAEKTAFSVVIPFRNEAKHLPDLLLSIAEINYITSLFEIVFVDDESSDSSVAIIEDFVSTNSDIDIRILKNKRSSNSPKKDAISTAINHTKHDWIITTDADCIVPKLWLQSLNNFIRYYKPNMIVAPVALVGTNSLLHQFQCVDFLSMQGATIGSFGLQKAFMANGANLAYRKELFLQLNGFESNNQIASGDDVFLLEDFVKHDKKGVHFIKNTNALVQTYVLNSWLELIQQRKRWASKAPQFNNWITIGIGALVFTANLVMVILFGLLAWFPKLGWLVAFKFLVDTILIFKTASFYQQPICLTQYIKTLFVYPFFTVYIAIVSMTSTFQWKGREFRN